MHIHNFRESYIQRAVVDDTEAHGKELDDILGPHANRDIDLPKMRNYAWIYKVSPHYRRQLWKVLTGITPLHPEIKQRIEAHRAEEATILYRCLRMVKDSEKFPSKGDRLSKPLQRKVSITLPNNGEIVETKGREPDFIYQQTPSGKDIADMVLIFENTLFDSTIDNSPLAAIADHLLVLCRDEYWTDAFQLTRALGKIIETTYPEEEDVENAVEECREHLAVLFGKSHPLTDPNTFSSRFPVSKWIKGGGAGLIRGNRATHRFWDKLFTGEATHLLLKSLVTEYFIVVEKEFGKLVDKIAEYRLPDDRESRLIQWVIEKVYKTSGARSSRQNEMNYDNFIGVY